jgi:hypothetical protein
VDWDALVGTGGCFTINPRGQGGGKRAKPHVTDADKLERLVLKTKGDVRRVKHGEVAILSEVAQSYKGLIDGMRNNQNFLVEKMSERTVQELTEALEMFPTTTGGKGSQLKMHEVLKVIVPEIAKVEQCVDTLKAMYSECVAEALVVLAKNYHNVDRNPEYAQFDIQGFKKSIEGIIVLKTQQQMREQVQRDLQAQASAAFDARVQMEVQRVLAQQRADRDANPDRDVDM